jgi:hypothetical protein
MPDGGELRRICAFDDGVEPRGWTHIVLHHSAGAAGSAASIERYHRSLGWEHGLGYHFVVGNGTGSGDGEIEAAPRWRRQQIGAHCRAGGMNEIGIGICFVGNFDRSSPTAAQVGSGIALVQHLAARFDIASVRIIGHREAPGAATRCPGRAFPVGVFRAAARPFATRQSGSR